MRQFRCPDARTRHWAQGFNAGIEACIAALCPTSHGSEACSEIALRFRLEDLKKQIIVQLGDTEYVYEAFGHTSQAHSRPSVHGTP